MTSRRKFLAMLAGSALAPFIPAITTSPALESPTLADIVSGRVPLFLYLGNGNGVIESFGRQAFSFTETITFPAATETCTATCAILSTADRSWQLPVPFRRSSICLATGDTMRVGGFEISDV